MNILIAKADADAIADILMRCGLDTNGPGWGPTTIKRLGEFADAAEMGDVQVAMGEVFHCDASSFADPADIAAFKKCKATGKSDVECFAVGDNGIGQFDKITAQEDVAMVAVHGDAMKSKWGSINGAAHKPVIVTANGKTITATVEDRISAPGRIDLNPAAAKQLGLKPPFVVSATWRWA